MAYTLIMYLAIVISVLTTLYRYYVGKFSYWSSRGVNCPKPIIFVGTFYFWKLFTKPVNELVSDTYKKHGRIHGGYFGTRPIITVAEPELIRNITKRDFHLFVDRQDFRTNNPLLERSLFNLKGDDWKRMRSLVSSTFSSGKMHPLIEECVQRLMNVLTLTANSNNNEIDAKKLMGNLTMDVIASCAFAIKLDTHNDLNNPFIKHAFNVFARNPLRAFLVLISASFPKISKLFKIQFLETSTTDFFKSAIRAIIQERTKASSNNHNDFLQLLMDASKKTEVDVEHDDNVNDAELHDLNQQSDNINSNNTKQSAIELEEIDVLANAFAFFIAGYETTATLLSYLLYSLAVNPECQQKLYNEIKRFGENVDYDTISRMPYLDACISETLRLYTPLLFIHRRSSEDYPLGDTGIVLEKGIAIHIPVYAIHHDPEYYPTPCRFDPNRFLPENRDKLIPYSYLPFGAGPRNCVGMRLALIEAKTAIVHMIQNFNFVPTINTKVPIEFAKFISTGILQAKNITVGVESRK